MDHLKRLLKPSQLIRGDANYVEQILALLIVVAVPLTILSGMVSVFLLHKPISYRLTNHFIPLLVQIITWVLLKRGTQQGWRKLAYLVYVRAADV